MDTGRCQVNMACCPWALQGHWLSPAEIITPNLARSLTSRPQNTHFYLNAFVRTDKAVSLDCWGGDMESYLSHCSYGVSPTPGGHRSPWAAIQSSQPRECLLWAVSNATMNIGCWAWGPGASGRGRAQDKKGCLRVRGWLGSVSFQKEWQWMKASGKHGVTV